MRQATKLVPPEGLYDEFCARFPYDETEDQLAAIEAVLDDLASGRPMDRLVCGDVGFGKTEVALRAAFCAAINGKQVAVVVPTTLLARQHYKTFLRRASPACRCRSAAIVAHGRRRRSARDEEGARRGQRSTSSSARTPCSARASVSRISASSSSTRSSISASATRSGSKELRAEVHVLTLSATPIPRTLQLAMTGVRELSLIATPPVDRLAVRSFVSPFDPLIVREALLRERYRGGQAFFVCPRIEDLEEAAAFLRENRARVEIRHGAWADGGDRTRRAHDGLLRWQVRHSAVDDDRRIGPRHSDRQYAHRLARRYVRPRAALSAARPRRTLEDARLCAVHDARQSQTITPQAQKRLEVLQTLDTLGAGFQLASHDLDIRGAGNLLGEEQSGHIKEVGYELYQQMLGDAITLLKAGVEEPQEEVWSPTIAIGAPVTIPEDYVPDLTLRLQLYRRLSTLETDEDIESFAAEMIDRFGPIPPEVEQLLEIVAIKAMCRRAHVEKVDAGPKGVIVSFRDNHFADPAGLVRYVSEQGTQAKVRPDMRIVFIREFDSMKQRLDGTRRILHALVGIAEKGKAA